MWVLRVPGAEPTEKISRGRSRAKVLVTGAGDPAASTFLRLAARDDVDFYAADADAFAAGLYLVPAGQRLMAAPSESAGFADSVRELCRRHGIAVVVPGKESELMPLALRRAEFENEGITLVSSPASATRTCLESNQLFSACGKAGIRVARSGLDAIRKPVVGRDVSVDVFVRRDRAVVAAVPRMWDRVEFDVAVAGHTLDDPEAVDAAVKVCQITGVRGAATIRFTRDGRGRLVLKGVKPSWSGSFGLTAAAGVNLPAIALGEALGEKVPDSISFREVAVVRHVSETIVESEEYADLAAAPTAS